MLYETTHGSASPISVARGDGDKSMMMFAVLVVLIVFVFVIFAFRKDERGLGGIAEIAALGMVNRGNHDGVGAYNYMMAHDGQRDNLREFAHIREEIKDTAYTQSRESDRYFFDTNRNIDQAKFDAYKATKESEEKILLKIDEAEKLRMRDELMQMRFERSLWYRSPVQGNFATIQQIDAGLGHGYA